MGFFKRLFNPVYGLIEANVQVYFRSRAAGNNHQSALRWMVETRYGLVRDEIAGSFLAGKLTKIGDQPWADDLKRIILYMLTFEVVQPSMEWVAAFDNMDKAIEESGSTFPKFPMPYSSFIVEIDERHGASSRHQWFKFFDDLERVIHNYRRKYPSVNLTDQ